MGKAGTRWKISKGEIMSLVTVYAIEVYDPVQDAFVVGRGMATIEAAKKNGWRIVKSISEKINSSLINERGRYHSPQSKT